MIIYSFNTIISIVIDMIEEIYNQPRMNNYRMKEEDKNNIEFDKIVKFLNAQKAVMDYAGLN